MKAVEHDRYLKALRALIGDKGDKNAFGGCESDEWREQLFQDLETQMTASNSQYYNNRRAYEKSLRDILHSISQFK